VTCNFPLLTARIQYNTVFEQAEYDLQERFFYQIGRHLVSLWQTLESFKCSKILGLDAIIALISSGQPLDGNVVFVKIE
jgi:hypothetical protein